MRKVFIVLISLLLIVATSAAQATRELTHRVTFDTDSGLAIASAYNDGGWDVTYVENTDAFEVFDIALLGPRFGDHDTLYLPAQLADEERTIYYGFQVYDIPTDTLSEDVILLNDNEHDYEGLNLSSVSSDGRYLWLTAVYGTHAYLFETNRLSKSLSRVAYGMDRYYFDCPADRFW